MDDWGSVDFFDLQVDLTKLTMKENDEENENSEQRINLKEISEENRLVLL